MNQLGIHGWISIYLLPIADLGQSKKGVSRIYETVFIAMAKILSMLT